MTAATHARIPPHLRKYVVEQNYERYTPEDQAVWRYILRQLKAFLSVHAHESYRDGLEKTGITIDRIPRIEDIDAHLERFGWGAVPVSGFIPPAAFMEFQAIGVLPIASDMRTLSHLRYTPAPDIVHEAAGHAPILVHPEYAAYIRKYGEVARHSILSREDLDQYEAIRVLSDIKEDPRSTPDEIARAERRLQEVNRSLKGVSEAALLSRMNWWTAEYGLIGDLSRPKIFGAGLLSSVGESRECLDPKVKKLPLSVDCVEYTYDITEPQPQLFVARDFAQLGEVLDRLSERLSYRLGGVYGLETAKAARTVNTARLNSGIQISGVVGDFERDGDRPTYLRFSGPCQLAVDYQELPGQGMNRHPEGFSSPVGILRGQTRCLSTFTPSELEQLGLARGKRGTLEYVSGVKVEGELKDWTYHGEALVVLTFRDCRVTLGDKTLFDPAWGEYDMAVGCRVDSVFGGPADRSRLMVGEDFANKRVPPKKFTREEQKQHESFRILRELRETGTRDQTRFRRVLSSYLAQPESSWLLGIELLEMAEAQGVTNGDLDEVRRTLQPENFSSNETRQSVRDGLDLLGQKL